MDITDVLMSVGGFVVYAAVIVLVFAVVDKYFG